MTQGFWPEQLERLELPFPEMGSWGVGEVAVVRKSEM